MNLAPQFLCLYNEVFLFYDKKLVLQKEIGKKKEARMKIWLCIKSGLIPLVVVAIPIWLAFKLWEIVGHWGFKFSKLNFVNVPLNIAAVSLAAFLLGYLLGRPRLRNFLKDHCVSVPFPFSLALLLFLPKGDVKLVQLETYTGNWEYALETTEPWTENGVFWHRVHTLGWTGRLFARVRDQNIRAIDRPERAVWATIFSIGLLNPPK